MPAMYFSGPAALAALLGDNVAYRSLRPCDQRIGFAPPAQLPRKLDAAYGALVVELLGATQAVTRPGVAIRRTLVIGDNLATDGTMFRHVRALLGSGEAVIVDETGAPPTLAPGAGGLARADGWAALEQWAAYLSAQNFVIDQHTAVILDVDKTLLGPRGRNAQVIDGARRHAMRATLTAVVGAAFDDATFERALVRFNTPAFHPFTGDNQDYVALLCLIVSGGIYDVDALAAAISGGIADPGQLLADALDRPVLPTALQRTLAAIQEGWASGDPTPFKAFRQAEYRATVAAMNVASTWPTAARLDAELCITGEVWALAQRWQRQGALVMALSDKPDEAALPAATLAAEGFRPLHHIATHLVSAAPLDL